MSFYVRRFNDVGLRAISLRLLDISAGFTTEIEDLLEDESLTELVDPRVTIEIRAFSSRRDAAETLTAALSLLIWDDIANDSGLWTWLAAAWMDVLAPVTDGRRKLGAINRWLLASDWKRYYRHIFAGPCYIYKAHEDDPSRADAVLCGSVSSPGEVVEQVASRLDLVRSPGIMGAITELYFDDEKKKLKVGAGGKTEGSARRLGPVLMQFDRTWDVQDLPIDDVLALLPREFDKFKSHADL